MHSTYHRCLAGVLVLAALPSLPRAGDVMTYVFHVPESALDVRYAYHWEILRTALEKTKAGSGRPG